MAGSSIASLLGTRDLPVDEIRSITELGAIREQTPDRRALERRLSESMADRESWTLQGVCQACKRAVAFESDRRYFSGRIVNFRERLLCPNCKLNNRKRFMAHLLERRGIGTKAPHAPTYLIEQVTPFFRWATERLQEPVIGSEYLGLDVEGGATVDGVRHEDALALSFSDASLGAIVSCDVFEHVPDIDRCLAECARVLEPGGHLIFSIPFRDTQRTVQRATVRGGEIVEHLPPQYHRNPVDPKGSLVFYDHGWDILERCRDAGFADAYALGYWSLLYGYLGEGIQLVFVAETPR